MKKVVFFTFQGEQMCFTHVLLNAIDMHEKGIVTKIVIEGASTKLIKSMTQQNNPILIKTIKLGLIDSVCKACANQMGVLEFIQENTKLKINDDMKGHPPMEPYVKDGYQIIVL